MKPSMTSKKSKEITSLFKGEDIFGLNPTHPVRVLLKREGWVDDPNQGKIYRKLTYKFRSPNNPSAMQKKVIIQHKLKEHGFEEK
jgi:hypothetical protein